MAAYKGVFITKVDGAAELAKLFDELPQSLTDGVMRTAAKKAIQPVADMASALAPRGRTGNLKNSIVVTTNLNKNQRKSFPKRKGEVVVYAGPDYTLGVGGRHGHLVEFGTGPRYTEGGKYTGVMPAHPFMRPAWDALWPQVLQTMQDEVWGVLVKAVRRLRKRTEAGKLSKSQTKFFSGG